MFPVITPFGTAVQIVISNKKFPISPDQFEKEHAVAVYQMKQVHGNTVRVVDENTPNFLEADAVCTNSKNIALSVRFADCQNFVLYDPVTQCIALVHAGYKGLIVKVLTACIRTLKTQYGANPSDILVYSTASLQRECAEFTDPLAELPGIEPKFFSGRHADLVAIAKNELQESGIQQSNIHLSVECTKCNTGTWYSYRGEQSVKEGKHRNVLFACLHSKKTSL